MSKEDDQQNAQNQGIKSKDKKHKKKRKLVNQNSCEAFSENTYSRAENGVESYPITANDGEFTKKKHKKKKKSRISEDSRDVLHKTFHEDSEMQSEKRVKSKDGVSKKRKAEAIDKDDTNINVEETSFTVSKKRKGNISDAISEHEVIENPRLKQKKKKGKEDYKEMGENGYTIALKEKKSKKHEVCENNTQSLDAVQSEVLEENGNGATPVKKRKKHKKRITEAAEDSTLNSAEALVTDQDNEKTLKKKKKHKKQKHEEYGYQKTQDASAVKSLKADEKSVEISCEEKGHSHKKSKKHSKDKTLTETLINCAAEMVTEGPSTDKSKQKRSKEKVNKQDTQDEDNKNSVTVISAISSKSANLAENDRNGLQPKITRSSPTDNSTTTTVSQWEGKLFESHERQDKFLRLLGAKKNPSQRLGETTKLFSPARSGNKKGLFGSLASKASTGNTALTAAAAADLNQRLEDDYNKAMNFKLTGKKGAGFGFAPDPAEGKKFHIDVSKSMSVKFDD